MLFHTTYYFPATGAEPLLIGLLQAAPGRCVLLACNGELNLSKDFLKQIQQSGRFCENMIDTLAAQA